MSAYVETRTVDADEAEQRLDRWFKRHFPAVGHGQLSKLLRTGQIRIDGKRAKANQRLEAGQQIRIPPLGDAQPHLQFAKPARKDTETGAELIEAVIYRDDEMIAINKPAGLAVQGGSGTTKHIDGALDSLRFGYSERPRLVHRLDKDTSGVLVLARTQRAARRLTHAFRAKSALKIYWALVVGEPKPTNGQIELPIGKLPGKLGEKMAVDHENGQSAVTRYVTLEKLGRRAALVALSPVTGRTHQLRVHMEAIGTPILGDGKYGAAEAFLQGEGISRKLHLHARAIRIPDEDGVPIEIIAPLQDHMIRSFDFFGLEPELDGSPFEPFEE
ncbi:RluA family pseudouridine synthase [Thalassobaculum litoreum]|uniref:Pseudouridine synthase n=1 Tax=Thalassobaculum litoreum DSM 18839 TaxID=1123362 RepID=A0A8G2BNP5_9PROT|nr:RluA family pseudouridine synthase [Thalassobaculum litoreum]SDG47236.1 23S rRNA pseudouridine955/2504/2580 synthase [Thalassobaculum litoreum DSM 18839]